MLKKTINAFFLITISISLLGCSVGSKVRVKDTDTEALFPSLHSVPERPVFKKQVQEKPLVDQRSKTIKKETFVEDIGDQNEKLRRQFGL